MEIHIDTKKDSNDEIRRAIRMLQAYVGDGVSSSYSSSSSSSNTSMPDASPGMFGMFNDGDSSTSTNTTPSNTETKEDEDEDKTPRIQIVDY